MYLSQSLQKAFSSINVYQILQPQMVYEISYSAALQAIDATLMTSLKNYSEIQRYLMLAISDACPMDQSRVYTVDLCQAPFNFIEGEDGVWSQNFLFYNIVKHRILIFILRAIPEVDQEQNDGIFAEEDYDCDYDYPKELNENEYQEAFPNGSKFFTLL